jgi:hypothetical protein
VTSCPYGFRIVGSTCEPRRLVDAAAALAGYAACNERAEVGREAYLSAFQFGEDFRRLLAETDSTAGFSGPCWSPWLWLDIDAEEDLARAQADAGALVETIAKRYGLDPGDLLVFFSGSKGFHVGLPTGLWSPPPALDFHRTARRFAEHVADQAAVTIDAGVYDRVRAFRAPNSRHPKTGLHKRRLTFDELMRPLERTLELAKTPATFDLPTVAKASDQAAADWQAAVALVGREGEAKAARRAAGNGAPTLNRSTLDFIRQGAGTGDRHRLLFSAAANLREFGCPPSLAFALLEEAGLDSGLPPKEVHRQIECGVSAVASPPPGPRPSAPTESSELPTPVERPLTSSTPALDLQAALARLWASPPAPLPTDADGGSPADLPPGGTDQAKGPTGNPPKPAGPTPPPWAKFHFVGKNMRPCSPAGCYCWTWEGADRWYHTSEYPVPGTERGREP